MALSYEQGQKLLERTKREAAGDILGMNEGRAREFLELIGFRLAVRGRVRTREVDMNRLNVVVEDGAVTEVWDWG